MTNAEALPTALGAAAPLVSPGIDRVVRARIAIGRSNAFSPVAFAALLRLSE